MFGGRKKKRQNQLIYQDNHDGVDEYYYEKELKRINFLNIWLDKINKKYNYDKTYSKNYQTKLSMCKMF